MKSLLSLRNRTYIKSRNKKSDLTKSHLLLRAIREQLLKLYWFYLIANCCANSSKHPFNVCCKSFKISAASSSSLSPPIDWNIFSNWTLNCWILFIKMHAWKQFDSLFTPKRLNFKTYYSFFFQMISKFFFLNISIGNENL